MEVFLLLNGAELEAPTDEVVTTMVALAEGTLTEAQLAQWIREHLQAAT